jgi:hypothetical protein
MVRKSLLDMKNGSRRPDLFWKRGAKSCAVFEIGASVSSEKHAESMKFYQ